MTTDSEPIWPLTPDDLDWVLEPTRQRREKLASHAPRFWNPAPDATERHRGFLAHLIDDPEVLSVRTASGYLMAVDRGDFWLVDDMVMSPDSTWLSEGTDLLRHAQEECGRVRFVVPAFEAARLAAAYVVGLEPAECWWHRDTRPSSAYDEGAGEDPDVVVTGARGRLVAAPPVYDPGGWVLLVTDVSSTEALHRVEDTAGSRGACVSVVSQAPNDPGLADILTDAGYVLTTLFFEEAGSPTSARLE